MERLFAINLFRGFMTLKSRWTPEPKAGNKGYDALLEWIVEGEL